MDDVQRSQTKEPAAALAEGTTLEASVGLLPPGLTWPTFRQQLKELLGTAPSATTSAAFKLYKQRQLISGGNEKLENTKTKDGATENSNANADSVQNEESEGDDFAEVYKRNESRWNYNAEDAIKEIPTATVFVRNPWRYKLFLNSYFVCR